MLQSFVVHVHVQNRGLAKVQRTSSAELPHVWATRVQERLYPNTSVKATMRTSNCASATCRLGLFKILLALGTSDLSLTMSYHGLIMIYIYTDKYCKYDKAKSQCRVALPNSMGSETVQGIHGPNLSPEPQ